MAAHIKSTKRIKYRKRATKSNPSLKGIAVGGLYIYAGMWMGGMIGGLIAPLTSSLPFGGILGSLLSAYAVGWIGDRFGNGTLMGAGAFAGAVGSIFSGVLGGLGSLTAGLTSGGGAAPPPQPQKVVAPAQAIGQQAA